MPNKKFDYAITLLQHKEAQISDIAKKLNYYSIQNFIIAFKKSMAYRPLNSANKNTILLIKMRSSKFRIVLFSLPQKKQ